MIIILAIFAAVTPLVIVTELQDQWVLPKLAATAAFTGLALGWGALQLARDRWPSLRVPTAVWVALAAWLVVNLLAFAFSISWRNALLGEYLRYQGLATVLLYLLLFGVALVAVRGPRDLRWLLIGLFAGAVSTSIYALMQKAGIAWWPDPLPDRPGSTVGQANELGAYLVVAGSASVFLVLTAEQLWQRAIFGAGLVIMIAALAVTTSQSAYLAAGVVIVIFGLAIVHWGLPALSSDPAAAPAAPVKGRDRGERRRRQRELQERTPAPAAAMSTPPRGGLVALVLAVTALPLLLAFVVIFFVGLPGREAVVEGVDSENVQGRLSLWQLGAEMTFDRPLLGHGQDAYSLQFAGYRDQPDLKGIGVRNFQPESSHNFFVDLAANTGLLGLLSFLALVGAIFWYAWRALVATKDVALRVALIAVGTAITGYLAAIFFGFSEAMTTWVLWLLLGALAGLVARYQPDASADEAPAATPPGLLVSTAAGLVLMVIAVVAVGWAGTLVVADYAAARATEDVAALDFDEAARHTDRAVTLNPLQKRYLLQEAEVYERAFIRNLPRADSFRKAIDLYETALSRFEPQAFDAYGLAQVKRKLAEEEGTPFDDLVPDYELAVTLDEYNAQLRRLIITVYRSEGREDLADFHGGLLYCWSPGVCE